MLPAVEFEEYRYESYMASPELFAPVPAAPVMVRPTDELPALASTKLVAVVEEPSTRFHWSFVLRPVAAKPTLLPLPKLMFSNWPEAIGDELTLTVMGVEVVAVPRLSVATALTA